MAYHEIKIETLPAFRDPFIRLLSKKGSLGFVEDDQFLTAYFHDSFDIRPLIKEFDVMRPVLELADRSMKFSYRSIPEQDWNESWKKGFTPLDVGQRFTILPPWEKQRPGRINLIIDPGMAFGTGHHETTRSCLVLMERYDGRVQKGRFLDLGTGTGLLAIAASKLGYRHVVAVDTDALATEASRKNIELNSVANVEIRDGSIKDAAGSFDCIAANIISGVLILLAPDLASHLQSSGIAILSGILAEQAEEVATEMQKTGLEWGFTGRRQESMTPAVCTLFSESG